MNAVTQLDTNPVAEYLARTEPGAVNAAILAVQIIARKDEKLAAALRRFKETQAKAVEAKNRALQEKLGS